MNKYKVVLYYRYKYETEIEAESSTEALSIAEDNAEEVYDVYLDSEVRLLEEGDE